MEKKPWYKNPFLWYFLIGAATLTLLRPFLRREPPPPPVLFQLPPFELVDQNSKPFSLKDLEGNVWVVDFIFTRCPSICPMLTQHMLGLQARYDAHGLDGIKLMSITVDPGFDTPEVLRAYAELNDADPARWTFLTGETDAIREFVTEGLATPMGEAAEVKPGVVDITHSGKFVIVDGSGGVRGYYDTDPDGLDEIYHRSRHVLNESP